MASVRTRAFCSLRRSSAQSWIGCSAIRWSVKTWWSGTQTHGAIVGGAA